MRLPLCFISQNTRFQKLTRTKVEAQNEKGLMSELLVAE